MVRKQRAREPAKHARKYETEQLVAVGREPDRPHAPLVRARALDHHAEARVHKSPDNVDCRQQQCEAEIVERYFVREIDESAELAAFVDGHAVVAAVPVEPDRDEIGRASCRERVEMEVVAAAETTSRK